MRSFRRQFAIVAAVDSSPEIIGRQITETICVQDFENAASIIKENDIRLAMLTVPASAAQPAAERLVACGIKGILTYAPVILNLPDDIRVEYIDPLVSLQHITYYI